MPLELPTLAGVSAKDLGTGKEQKITITANSGLSEEEVEKMKADAEANADEDRKRRESVETRNQADNVLYQSEKFLKENGDKVPGEQKQQLEDATKTLEEALKGSDADQIKSSSDALMEVFQKISTELYQNAAAAQGAQAEGAPASGSQDASPKEEEGQEKDEGTIIDAEVVEEKKD